MLITYLYLYLNSNFCTTYRLVWAALWIKKKPPIIVLFNSWDSKNHLGGELQMFFELQKQSNNSWGFDLLWVLKCLLTSLSTLQGYILNPVLWIFDNWWVSEYIPKLTIGGLIQRIAPCYYIPLHFFEKNQAYKPLPPIWYIFKMAPIFELLLGYVSRAYT